MIYNDEIVKRYDIFCDASGTNKIGVCSGCAIIDLDYPSSRYMYTTTSYNTSSNRGELLAIYLALQKILDIRKNIKYDTKFRIFSDSKLSIDGIKYNIPTWVKNERDGIWYTSSNKVVNNQDIYKYIYNLILENNLYVEFYVQKAHVPLNMVMSAESYFDLYNNKSLGELGLTPEYICRNNNLIDGFTRSQLLLADSTKTEEDNLYQFQSCVDIDYSEFDTYQHYTLGGYNKYKEAVLV